MIFYDATMFAGSIRSYDMQIYPLSFTPYRTQIFAPPCTDPSTQPHIQDSDALVSCRLNLW